MQKIKFTKMHGLGNDFMVIDAISQTISLDSEQIQRLSNRHTGIGFDQLLLVEKSLSDNVDFKYRIFNFDGSEVEQCGNGARCFARFVQSKGLSHKNPIIVETSSGIISLSLQGENEVCVNMGQAIFDADRIPVIADAIDSQQKVTIEINGEPTPLSVLSMGNPHAVILMDHIDNIDIDKVAKTLQNHPAFPKRVNVGFMEIVDQDQIKLRVYERGSGETQACGTGACAAVVAGILMKKLNNKVLVQLKGGDLNIEWQGQGQDVFMTGPTASVFEGEISV